jgi:hypothetical protein
VSIGNHGKHFVSADRPLEAGLLTIIGISPGSAFVLVNLEKENQK